MMIAEAGRTVHNYAVILVFDDGKYQERGRFNPWGKNPI